MSLSQALNQFAQNLGRYPPSAFFNFTENSLYVFDTFIIKSLSLTVKRNLYRLFYYQNR